MGCAEAVGSGRRIRNAATAGAFLLLGAGCRHSPPAGATSNEPPKDASDDSSSAVAELPPPPPAPAPPPAAPPPGPEEAGSCPANADETLGFMSSPIHAFVGSPMRVMTATLTSQEPL